MQDRQINPKIEPDEVSYPAENRIIFPLLFILVL